MSAITDDQLAELANKVEAVEQRALELSMSNVAERLGTIRKELDAVLGNSLVRKYRGQFKADAK